MKSRLEVAEAFSADEMAQNFIRAHRDVLLSVGQLLLFDFHGQMIKLQVKGVQTVDLPNAPASHQGGSFGVLMEKTDINISKAADSTLKLKSSAKKCVLSYSGECHS